MLQESGKTRLELMQLQRLREHIRKLELRRHPVQAHVAVLDREDLGAYEGVIKGVAEMPC